MGSGFGPFCIGNMILCISRTSVTGVNVVGDVHAEDIDWVARQGPVVPTGVTSLIAAAAGGTDCSFITGAVPKYRYEV